MRGPPGGEHKENQAPATECFKCRRCRGGLFCLFQTRFPHSSTLQVGGKARFASVRTSQLENSHSRKARVSGGWLNPALAGLTFEVRTQLAFGFAACPSHVHQTQSGVSNCAGFKLI